MNEVNSLFAGGINALEILGDQAGISADEIREQISKGAISADMAIAGLVNGMNDKYGGMMSELEGTWSGTMDKLASANKNAGAELMRPYMDTLTQLLGGFTNFVNGVPNILAPAFQAFVPLVEMLNDMFNSDKYTTFFEHIAISLLIVAELISGMAQAFLFVIGIIMEYWPVVAGMLAVLIAFYLPSIIAGLWGMINTVLLAVGSWLLLNWPIALVMLLVGTLIAVMMYFGITTGQVIGFIVGLFFLP